MSGAEAITVIQLIDACIGIAKTIIDIGRAVRDAHGLPPKLRELFEQLPAIEDLFTRAQEKSKTRGITENADRSIQPVLKQCERALRQLQDIFQAAYPTESDNRSRCVWRGAKAVYLGRESQLQKISKTIQDNLRLSEQKELFLISDKLDALQLCQLQEHDPLVPSSNVPFRRDPNFVHRAALSEQIRVKLSAPAGKVALVGLGGVGKSQLAIEYAHQLRIQSPETWVFWIHASNTARFDQSVRDITDRLKLSRSTDPKVNHLQLLRLWLQDESKGPWLIVLDNADDASFLLEPPTTVGEAQVGQSKTAARKLVFEVEITNVLPMSEEEAEVLLQSKIGQSGEEDRQLVRALECMPLAITQAAAYTQERKPRCSVQQYRDEIERSQGSRTSLLRRHVAVQNRDREASNSVILTWQISFEYVYQTRRSAAELLSLMSLYDRLAIPEILLRADVGDPESPRDESDFEEDIIILRSFSFISETADGQSWEMHRLLQDAAQMWLADHGRFSNVLDRFVYCLATLFPTGSFENWATCRTLFPHAKSIVALKPAGNSVQLTWASVMFKAAWYPSDQGDNASALAMALGSMIVRSEQLGEEDDATLASMSMIAHTYSNEGRLTEAEQLDVEVAETSKTVLGAEHPRTLIAIACLASTYRSQGRWAEAEQLQVKVAETLKTVLGAEHPHTLSSVADLALTYGLQKRWAEAEQLFVKVTETSKTVLGAEHPSTLRVMAHLASTYCHQGRWTDAEQLQMLAVRGLEKSCGLRHPTTLGVIEDIARLQRRREQALLDQQCNIMPQQSEV